MTCCASLLRFLECPFLAPTDTHQLMYHDVKWRLYYYSQKTWSGYIFACFLKQTGLTHSHHLLVRLLDVPLHQILSLLSNFNHIWQKGRSLKDKSSSESHANQYIGCGGETTALTPVWELIATRAQQPWGFWPVNVQQTSEPAKAPSASCPQECWGTGVGHKDSQGTSVVSEVL